MPPPPSPPPAAAANSLATNGTPPLLCAGVPGGTGGLPAGWHIFAEHSGGHAVGQQALPAPCWNAAAAVPLRAPIALHHLGPSLPLLGPPVQPLGSITVPELVRVRSPLEEEYGTSHQQLHRCGISGLPAASGGTLPALLVVECPRELPQEQATAWAKRVMAALQPRAAVVAATLPAMSYRGPGSPADEDLVFSLQTAAAEAAAAAGGGSGAGGLPPPLPGATLLGGLPAALLARCELQQLPAALVAGVQQQQVADAQFLFHLGRGAAAALRLVGGGAASAALAKPQPRPQLLAGLAAAADSMYRSSASSSIFS